MKTGKIGTGLDSKPHRYRRRGLPRCSQMRVANGGLRF